MKHMKTVLAVSAVAVYFACPAYRYYIIGSWIGLKILDNKPPRTRVVEWRKNDVGNTRATN